MCMSFVVGVSPLRDLDGEERPFEVFCSLGQLDDYRQIHRGDFFNLTDEQYADFDEEFFRRNALVMFLSHGMSGSIRCEAEGAFLQGDKLVVRVRELSPSMHTMDLKYNTLAVAVEREQAAKIRAVVIDAYRVDV